MQTTKLGLHAERPGRAGEAEAAATPAVVFSPDDSPFNGIEDAEPRGETVESVHLLDGGAQAYPRMLLAIAEAKRTVHLEIYAFAPSLVGTRFIEALGQACNRGQIYSGRKNWTCGEVCACAKGEFSNETRCCC